MYAVNLNIHRHPYVWQKQGAYILKKIYLCDNMIRNNVAFGVMAEENEEESPEVPVLDEVISALDNETEAVVIEAVDNLQGTKMILIIAHRLTTIPNADIIYEVVGGKVVKRLKESVFPKTEQPVGTRS